MNAPMQHPLRAFGTQAILQAVAFQTGLRAEEIAGPCRRPPVYRARAAVCWLARRLTGLSLPLIGRALGGRDHSSILHAVARAEEMRDADPAFRLLTNRLVDQFEKEIRHG